MYSDNILRISSSLYNQNLVEVFYYTACLAWIESTTVDVSIIGFSISDFLSALEELDSRHHTYWRPFIFDCKFMNLYQRKVLPQWKNNHLWGRHVWQTLPKAMPSHGQATWAGSICALQSRKGKYRVLLGNPWNENRVPCNENRFFTVRINLQEVPCKPYRVWVCSEVNGLKTG